MERRFLFATILSVLILWTWSILAPHPLPHGRNSEVSQLYGDKLVTQINVKPSVIDLARSSEPSLSPFNEKIEKMETNKLAVEFSNKGGVLKQIELKEYGAILPVRNIAGQEGYEALEFRSEKISDREIFYTYSGEEFFVRRSYKISADDYTIEANTEIQNKTNMSKLMEFIGQGVILDTSRLDKSAHEYSRERSLFEYVISSESGIVRKNNAFKFSASEKKEQGGEVSWVGFRNRYFCLIVKPQYKTKSYILNPINDSVFGINIPAEKTNIEPMGRTNFSFLIFAGPEKPDLLKQYKMGFEDIQRYYRLTLFDAIAKIIYSALNGMHRIIPNWGVCILLISIIIYFMLYPLTLRSMLSMKKMQAIQPKIATLREKYKDNPQKLNIELLELYKKNQINPMGGCLPMLLQTPVFIGLYQVLWRAVSLNGAHFLWIKDLSQPDRLIILPFYLPFLGNEINLLPFVMAVVMAIQQKITSKNIVITDPNQMTQQRMMGAIMPIFLGVVFYQFASGLTLYFTIFYALSTFAQWKMSKMPSCG